MTAITPSLHVPVDVDSLLRDWRAVARLIDHTLVGPAATRAQLARLCDEAAFYGFASVSVHPALLADAVARLRGSSVKAGAPVGFPFGATLTGAKRDEAAGLVRLGAQELDMVMNVGALKSGERVLVQQDIAAVAHVAHDAGAIVKVILETGLLTIDEKILACELAVAAGADFVKTSTGTFGGPATADDVALMRGVVGDRARVKASGGIRSADGVAAMVRAGADRIGTSASVAIVRELGAPEFAA
ncbi:MAG TPA: deoxyribose-phosphate aldolase [Terriglobales bacterium]|nr:deoxyribose-phosphate aldolase [Terriglobales bacterium]